MKKVKIALLYLFIVLITATLGTTYAALIGFNYDSNRIVVESKFDYTVDVSDPNITIEDDKIFTFPAGSRNRTYNITFNIEGIQNETFYFGVYSKDRDPEISFTSGVAKGVVSGSSVSRTVTVRIKSTTSQQATIGVIVITQSEYNGSSTTITDVNGEVFTLVS